MSWVNKPQVEGGTQHPPSNNQIPGNQVNVYQNYQGPNQSNVQQQYWQTQQHIMEPQQYQHTAQHFAPNPNMHQQPTVQYNQNYPIQNMNNSNPGSQNYYQINHNQITQPEVKDGVWGDNWDWGWEDPTKKSSFQNVASDSISQVPPSGYNTNVLSDSFANTSNWNWSEPDMTQRISAEKLPTSSGKSVESLPNAAQNHVNAENTDEKKSLQMSQLTTLNDKNVIKERVPNLGLGRHKQSDNLTPQWSVESQMSLESSDGALTHSESTYHSENQSRNSTSPVVPADNSSYSQSVSMAFQANSEIAEMSLQQDGNRNLVQDNYKNIIDSMQQLNVSNFDNTYNSMKMLSNEENVLMTPCNNTASSNIQAKHSASMPPPTTNISSPSSIKSSLKNTMPIPQSNITKTLSSTHQTLKQSNPNLSSPIVVNKISQNKNCDSFSANLETTPDNSESPDQPQLQHYPPSSGQSHLPDNLEVAPRNDRNEYLQTALSSGDFSENTDFRHNTPPPGLKRLVVGQRNFSYGQDLNSSNDEPPPGLSRMVPGQQNEGSANAYNQPSDNYIDRLVDGQPTNSSSRPYRQVDGQNTPDYTQPQPNRNEDRRPIGFDRMVPGEPSSSEYNQYQTSMFSGANEQRVVTGLDRDFTQNSDARMPESREQHFSGPEQHFNSNAQTFQRNLLGSHETPPPAPTYSGLERSDQREVVMEGENLQDLSAISSTEINFSREQLLGGATHNDPGADRKADLSDSIDQPTSSSRRQSLNRLTSGEDSEKDLAYKSSKRDRGGKDRRDSPRHHDRDKESRYSRDDRKYYKESEKKSSREERYDRHSEKDRRNKNRDRRERSLSPDVRRHRKSNRSHRYETEDTDYCSDREREHRRYREGSHVSSRPPRPDRRYREDHYSSLRRRRSPTRDNGSKHIVKIKMQILAIL